MSKELDDLLSGAPVAITAPAPDPIPWTAILTALGSAVAALCLTALMILRVLSPEAGVPLLLAACGIAPIVHKRGKGKQPPGKLSPEQLQTLESRLRRRPGGAP